MEVWHTVNHGLNPSISFKYLSEIATWNSGDVISVTIYYTEATNCVLQNEAVYCIIQNEAANCVLQKKIKGYFQVIY